MRCVVLWLLAAALTMPLLGCGGTLTQADMQPPCDPPVAR